MRDDGEILKMHGTFEKIKYNSSEPLGECHQIFAKINNPYHRLNKSFAWSVFQGKLFATLADV